MERFDTDWNSTEYHVFKQMQAPFVIAVASYPELVAKKALIKEAGFEAKEHTSGGLSIEIADKDQFEKLQNFANEHNLKLTIPA